MSTATPAASDEGTRGAARATLDEHVMSAPEQGAGYLYPATAPGTPLTLLGFGITLGLLSLLNAEILNLAAVAAIVPVAFAVGGLALVVGGLWDFRAGNLFGAVVGIGYGVFWLSFALMVQFFAAPLVTAAGAGGFGDALGAYLLIWAVVTAGLTVGAFFVNKLVFAAFVVLTLVFLVLGFANTGASTGLTNLGGVLGLIDAAIAIYLGLAIVVNATADRDVMPIL